MKCTMFEINFYKYKINEWDKKKKLFLELINTTEQNTHKNILAKVQTQTTSYFDNSFDVYDIIKEDLQEFVREINFDINFLNSWYQIYKKHDYHEFHTHSNSYSNFFSGILFVSFDKKKHASTKFLNPFYSNPNNLFFMPEVEEGEMIIFPANILHKAPLNQSNQDRIIISFNMVTLSSEFENKFLKYNHV